MKLTNDDLAIYVVDQMYQLDWFSEETMTKEEESNINSKTWLQCKHFFEEGWHTGTNASAQWKQK